MEQNTRQFNNLTEKAVGRLLLEYAIPAVIAMSSVSLYNIIDGIFIGKGVSEKAIMGLALTTPIMSLTAAFGFMVGIGASTLMSIRLGQRDYSTAQRILGNVILMNSVIGLSLGILMIIFIRPILYFFGASEVTYPYAHDFMVVILAGNVINNLYIGLNAILRSSNRPQHAMYTTIGTVVLNCIFAALFIFVLDWGISGAAFATVLAQAVMLGWEIYILNDKSNLIHFDLHNMRPDLYIIKESLIVGMPQFLMNLCACLVAAIMTRSLTTYGGDVAIGAFGIANRLAMFIIMVAIGINQGMQPIAGYNFGARRYDRVLKVLKYAILIASVITCAGFCIGTFFSTPFAELFSNDAPELTQLSAHAMKRIVLIYPIIGTQIVASAFFQSIGYAKRSIFLSLTRQLIFLVPAILILPKCFADPLEGLWYAFPFSDATASILTIIMLTQVIRHFKREASGIESLK